MTTIAVGEEALPIRASLASALDDAWRALAAPGTWWDGAERLSIAREARHAPICGLCQARKEALSPYTVTGSHDTVTDLPAAAVEAVHRVRTDAARITQAWVHETTAGELGEGPYVELLAVTAIITALDTFDFALGRPPRDLPDATPGTPRRVLPPGAARDLAWVSTVAPGGFGEGERDPYPVHGDKNIHRALSLVPEAVFDFFDLDVELYLKDHEIRDFATEHRHISHAQIELIAGRASALNGCFY